MTNFDSSTSWGTYRSLFAQIGVCVGIETDDGIGAGGYDYGTAYEAGFVEHRFNEFVIGNCVAVVTVGFCARAAPREEVFDADGID